MVSVSYLIDKPGPPSALKALIDRQLVPQAIDAAATIESAIYELGEQTRARPATALLTAGAAGLIIGATLFSVTRRNRW